MANFIKNFLQHPLTKGADLDDPKTTSLRLDIIRSKPFLRKIYEEWYNLIKDQYNSNAEVLEIGSGAGIMKNYIPNLITSDLFPIPGVDMVIDANRIDINDCSLDGIAMTNVLHHIPDCNIFFSEAIRVIRPGGKLVMIEPWNTKWSKWVYLNLHHEHFEPSTRDWIIENSGPLSSANGALPWIIFNRDRKIFADKFPELRVLNIKPIMPISYLLSGGISMRNILPGMMYKPVRFLEKRLKESSWAMFALITLSRHE
tara:strand:- start:90 stop:860 length:771 start_codon:yes stop_codon:yes gene_type:complete